MAHIQGEYPIIQVKEGAMVDYTILCPEMAQQAKAGQFVHIRVPGFTLRRPISICEVDKAAGTLRILFDIRGEGTKVLAGCKEGDLIDVMGPLGNGFDLLDPQKKAVVVGGGIGVPPMLETAKHYKENATAILGFRNKDLVVLTKDFEENRCPVMLCTDDGSLGHHGLVTDLLKKRIEEGPVDIVYACGPKIMLKFVAKMCQEHGIRCQVSLEERMGCGVGACLVCACKTKKENGEETYSHVCKNGPVFESEKVVFDE